MSYVLHDHVSGQEYSSHPNQEGAKLSALRYVNNGDKINWVWGMRVTLGYVNDNTVARFGIEKEK